MKENEFRYLVLQSLIVLANYTHRLARNSHRPSAQADNDLKDMADLIERLSIAKEEAMK